MKLLKKIALSMTLLLTIFTFYGCKGSSPSDYVKGEFDKLKNANEKLVSIMATAMLGKDAGEDEKEFTKELVKQAQIVTYEITSEKVSKDKATVYVDINGPDLEKVIKNSMTKIAKVAIDKAIAGEYMTSSEEDKLVMGIIMDELKNSKFTDRSGELNLVKENGKWTYEDENEINKLIFNFDPSTFDYNNVEDYIDEDALYDSLDQSVAYNTDSLSGEVKEMTLNQPFDVKTEDGAYTITIEGARLTDERDEYSDIKAKKVFYLDYTYANISSDDDLYISDYDFQILDEEGNVLGYYPLYDNNREPKNVPVGGKCKASAAFALTTDSKKINVVHSRYSQKVGKITLDLK